MPHGPLIGQWKFDQKLVAPLANLAWMDKSMTLWPDIQVVHWSKVRAEWWNDAPPPNHVDNSITRSCCSVYNRQLSSLIR